MANWLMTHIIKVCHTPIIFTPWRMEGWYGSVGDRWENVNPVYWEMDSRGIRKAWLIREHTFKENWDEFCDDLMRAFYKEPKTQAMARFLAMPSAQAVRARLKDSA